MWKYLAFFAIIASANSSPNGINYLNSLPRDELGNIRGEILEDALLNAVSNLLKSSIIHK